MPPTEVDSDSEGPASRDEVQLSDDDGHKQGKQRGPKAKKPKKTQKERNEAKKPGASRGVKAIKGGFRECSDCGVSKALVEFRSGSSVCIWPCQRVHENVRRAC